MKPLQILRGISYDLRFDSVRYGLFVLKTLTFLTRILYVVDKTAEISGSLGGLFHTAA